MSPTNRLYHAKRIVRLHGAKLQGWTPADINRLLKRQPAADKTVWTCGHKAGTACKECHRLLIEKANELQAEVDRLRGHS